jgi:hypothetical protein
MEPKAGGGRRRKEKRKMELPKLTEAINNLGGEFNARNKSNPRITTWKVEYRYWAKEERSRLYLDLIADGKKYPIGYINTQNYTFLYAPAGSYYKEPMAAAKAAIEKILKEE